MKFVVLAGRILFALIFVLSTVGHFTKAEIDMAAAHGVPLAAIVVPVAGLIGLAGGLSVAAGYRARVGAWLLVLFLVPVTFVMHNFWAVQDPATAQLQQIMFLKNISMLGGAFLIAFFGAGPLSIDAWLDDRSSMTYSAQKPERRVA
jgi:putative oxidoreductase